MVEKKVKFRKSFKSVEDDIPKLATKEIDTGVVRGTLPFGTASVINLDGDEMTEQLKQTSKAILDDEIYTPDRIKATAIKPPKPINIEDLPEEKQAELLAAVKQAAQRPSQTPVVKEAPFVPRHPSIAKAKALADKVAREAETVSTTPPDDVPASTTPETTDTAAEVSKPMLCTHCGFPTDKTDYTEPTKLDKQTFVAAILGQKRFYKTYKLLGDKLRVTFRSLTTDENDSIIKQLVADWNANKISGPAHSVAEATKYQLCLGLQSVQTDLGDISLPTLDGYDDTDVDVGAGTILPEVVKYVHEQALHNEPLRRIVSKTYGHFVDTVAKLEAMAESPDFWEAIEE